MPRKPAGKSPNNALLDSPIGCVHTSKHANPLPTLSALRLVETGGAAVGGAVSSHDALLAALKACRAALSDGGHATYDDIHDAIDAADAAIAKAEGAQLDTVARHLRRANTVEAIAQGIHVGQAAIDEILNGGPKVLGEKPT